MRIRAAAARLWRENGCDRFSRTRRVVLGRPACEVHDVGWNQGAHYALVRALADGTPTIDRTRFEVGGGGTGDISRIHGHYYAAKAPGLDRSGSQKTPR